MRDDDKLKNTTGTVVHDTTVHDANRDPLTGEPGSHPVGTGVGAAGGAATGAAIGGAVAGPPGALLGAAIGGIAGGFAGKGIAEAVNPTEEEAFWRSTYHTRPYATGRTYEDLSPAYRYGWESRGRYADRTWDQAENDLERGWDKLKDKSKLHWHEAKDATRDAWNRVEHNYVADNYWQQNYAIRPYAAGRSYDELRPAYRYGLEARNRYRGRRYEDVEGDLRSGWENFKDKSRLRWEEVKDAVRDAFTRDEADYFGGSPVRTAGAMGTGPGAAPHAGTVATPAYTTVGAGPFDDNAWRAGFSARPYVTGKDSSYDDYSPAYRYGWESRSRYPGRSFEDVENDLERGWDKAKGKSKLTWERAKLAVRDAWHGVERALPGDADRDGR
jgi:hypothetical protein